MRDRAPFDLGITLAEVEKSVREEDGDLIIEGYAADFERDREGDIFLPGAFDSACEKATRDEIPLLFEHDNTKQLGVVEKLKADAKGLWTRARVAKPTPGLAWAVDAYNKIRRGMMRGFSVHGITRVQQDPAGQHRIGDIDLTEVTVTPRPMQPGALFAVATKSLASAADEPAYTEAEIAEAVGDYLTRQLALFDDRAADLRRRLAGES